MNKIASLAVINVTSNTITKKQNQTLNVRVSFTYQGPAQQILFYAVVTQDTWYSDFDEIGSTKKSVYCQVVETATPGAFYLDIVGLPLSGVAAKTTAYGVKINAQGTFGTVEAGNKSCLYVQSVATATLSAEYQNGILYYSFANFEPNATVTLTVTQTGRSQSRPADSNGGGTGSITDPDPNGTYTLQATDNYGHSATTSFTISGVAAYLAAYFYYGKCYYSFSGFQPNATVTLTVVGGGYVTKTADSSGAGSGSFTDNDPAGTYTLRATDSYGHSATASFTISGVAATLYASYSNGVLTYSFSGFQPNATVTLTVTQTGGYVTKTADSSGSGSGSFTDNDPAGTYTLRATDSYDHYATATFTK